MRQQGRTSLVPSVPREQNVSLVVEPGNEATALHRVMLLRIRQQRRTSSKRPVRASTASSLESFRVLTRSVVREGGRERHRSKASIASRETPPLDRPSERNESTAASIATCGHAHILEKRPVPAHTRAMATPLESACLPPPSGGQLRNRFFAIRHGEVSVRALDEGVVSFCLH